MRFYLVHILDFNHFISIHILLMMFITYLFWWWSNYILSQINYLHICTDGKKLLTPQPRLRTGFFSVLESSMLTPSTINEACTSVGAAKYGRPIGLEIKVYLIVIGSVAVDPKTGARLGKGEVRIHSILLHYCFLVCFQTIGHPVWFIVEENRI